MTADRTESPIRSDWPRVAALAVLTVLGVALCCLLVRPFLSGVTWAVALAVVGLPMHRYISRFVKNGNWAAGVSTTVVILLIGVPVVLVAARFTAETVRTAEVMRAETEDGRWRESAARVPYVGGTIAALDANEVEARVREVAGQLATRSPAVVGGIMDGFLQSLVAAFVLFFSFRDRHHLLAAVRGLIPLTPTAADRVVERASDAVHATVYGTLLTAVLQGVTGGLLFWALGLPAPVLWGVAMVVFGVLPFVGAFLVWVPAAVYFVTIERFGAAAILVTWGLLMAGPVCNYLYAYAAGDRMGIHPVPTLLAFIGGLAIFGVAGMVLGPCVLTVTVALLDVWRHRLADGTPVAVRSDASPVPAGKHQTPARS